MTRKSRNRQKLVENKRAKQKAARDRLARRKATRVRKSGDRKGGLQMTNQMFPRLCDCCGHTIEQPARYCPHCGEATRIMGQGHGRHTAHTDSAEESFLTYAEVLDASLSNDDPEHPVRLAVRLARRRGALDVAHRIFALAWDLAIGSAEDPHPGNRRPVGVAELLERVRAELGKDCSMFESLLSSTRSFEQELLPAGSKIPDRDPWLLRMCPKCNLVGHGDATRCPQCGSIDGDGAIWATRHGVIYRVDGDYVFRDHDDVLDEYLGPEESARPAHPWRRAVYAAMRRHDHVTAHEVCYLVGRISKGGENPQKSLRRLGEITRAELGSEDTLPSGGLPVAGERVTFITAPKGGDAT